MSRKLKYVYQNVINHAHVHVYLFLLHKNRQLTWFKIFLHSWASPTNTYWQYKMFHQHDRQLLS